MKYLLRLITLVLIFPVFSMQGQDDPLLDILREEMNNAKEEFSKQEIPPYYFELSVTEVFEASINLKSGALVLCDTNRYIGIKADMRVGDHDFDNTHTLADDMWGGNMSMPRFASLPEDGNELETRYRIYDLLAISGITSTDEDQAIFVQYVEHAFTP